MPLDVEAHALYQQATLYYQLQVPLRQMEEVGAVHLLEVSEVLEVGAVHLLEVLEVLEEQVDQAHDLQEVVVEVVLLLGVEVVEGHDLKVGEVELGLHV